MKINRKQLHELYMEKIHEICDDLENKTNFAPNEIVCIICDVLESNQYLIDSDEYIRGYDAGYDAGLDSAYISNQSSGIVGDSQ
jgi:hypothetical protein